MWWCCHDLWHLEISYTEFLSFYHVKHFPVVLLYVYPFFLRSSLAFYAHTLFCPPFLPSLLGTGNFVSIFCVDFSFKINVAVKMKENKFLHIYYNSNDALYGSRHLEFYSFSLFKLHLIFVLSVSKIVLTEKSAKATNQCKGIPCETT